MNLFFLVLATLMVISALGIVVFKNPVYSALCLVANLLGVAALYGMLQAHFLAMVQIIVYAGAIMVLVVFVLMLLNLQVEAQKPLGKLMSIMALAAGGFFVWIVVPVINEVFQAFPENPTVVEGTVRNIGAVLYTKWVFPFEAASILILGAIVGAVMLAKRAKK